MDVKACLKRYWLSPISLSLAQYGLQKVAERKQVGGGTWEVPLEVGASFSHFVEWGGHGVISGEPLQLHFF